MAALAPITQWTPEDDLLLKNAVQAGASLESLAKGAVEFSRRHSFSGLQHRWYTLLYDPVISAEASERMKDYERSSSKQSRSFHRKRRAESVRSCYLAERKRMHHANQEFLRYESLGEPTTKELGFTNAEVDIHELLSLPSEGDMIGIHMLLDFPEDVNGDPILNLSELKSSIAPETCVEIPDRACSREMNIVGDNDMGIETDLKPEMKSPTSFEDRRGPEYNIGVICCVLNTEDPEIPCNNHLFFPSNGKEPSLHMKTSIKASMQKTSSTGQKGQSTMKKEVKRFGELHVGSHTVASDKEVFRTIVATPSVPKLGDKPVQASDKFNSHFITAGASNEDGRMPVALRNQEVHASCGNRDIMMLETGNDCSASDPEEQFSDSDAEIPYFSDIESMVLDMDLGPDDHDSYSSRKVANYQNEDVKRAIIRLEQSAQAYMQRAIASHRAFAVLYDRHSKHYIKKPDVLLGRATHDATVDIDLGREGRTNKISRRQAIIEVEHDGSFCMKNLGKRSIFVNNMEVHPGQRRGLPPNCLIEIRGRSFIFEANHTLPSLCEEIFGKTAAGNL